MNHATLGLRAEDMLFSETQRFIVDFFRQCRDPIPRIAFHDQLPGILAHPAAVYDIDLE